MRLVRLSLAACLTFAGLASALADSPRMAPLRQPTVQQYGAANADCAEWTNGCQICKRDAAGVPQCSTPGIACTPQGVTCKARSVPTVR